MAWSLGDVLRASAAYLGARGVDDARLEAELFMSDLLSLSRVELYTNFERPMTPAERDRLRACLRRRAAGEPLQYITGHRYFRRLRIGVGPGVLVPRPETELLVQAVIDAVTDDLGAGNVEALDVLDLGTGSGAVALSLAAELPGCRVVGVDCSREAIARASENAAAAGLTGSMDFLRGDYLKALGDEHRQRFDVIVSNPPYIPSADIDTLAVEVREHEPRLALDGGVDGLDAYRVIIPGAAAYLDPRGLLAVEVGEGQSVAVSAMMTENRYQSVTVIRDYADRDRVVIARVGGGEPHG